MLIGGGGVTRKRTIRRRVYTTLLYFEQMNEVFLMEENVLYALS